MERCVIHHTSYIVPSSLLPALKDTGPGGAPWPRREQESPSRHVLTACHIIFPCGGSDPSIQHSSQSPETMGLSIQGSPGKAKQSKIDALQTAGCAREGSGFNARSSPFFPISGSHTGRQSGSSEPGQQEFKLYSSWNTNDPPHSPNHPGSLTSPAQDLSEVPQAFLDQHVSHTALWTEELESREDAKRLGEKKYSFTYWPQNIPSPIPTPTDIPLSPPVPVKPSSV